MGIFHCYVSLPEGIRMSTSLGSTSLFRDALCIDPNSTLPNSTTCLSSIGNPAGFAVTAGFRDNTCSWKSPKNIPRIDARRSHLWTKSQPDSESRWIMVQCLTGTLRFLQFQLQIRLRNALELSFTHTSEWILLQDFIEINTCNSRRQIQVLGLSGGSSRISSLKP